jgi:hypothetical protein
MLHSQALRPTCIVSSACQQRRLKYLGKSIWADSATLRCYVCNSSGRTNSTWTLSKVSHCKWPEAIQEVNPTIASYKASAVKIYNCTSSLARFESKNISLYFKKRSILLHSTLEL